MGKSRSATVCVAYLLHQQPTTLNPGTALEVIRRSRPMVEPNEGFMAQLWLYHRMGCPDDVENHPMYQRWVSHQEIELSAACGRGPEMNLVRFEDELSTGPIGTSGDTSEIRCRRCRSVPSVVILITPGIHSYY
jgi:dual specificity phosphatase 12